ncbi:helix-turn-helix domain-containing protein [Pseudomonas sp. MYb118]|uniref:helix-turn-helix domain-containing protein n=1 Tax=Pseudomonas sp. MYb118 TaxID=1848720 RepID=UPI0034CF9131
MPLFRYKLEKYSASGLLLSSVDRHWNGLVAEVRSHSEGVIAKNNRQPTTELVLDTRGDSGAVVTRKAYDVIEQTPTKRGMAWICPKGIQEDLVLLSAGMPGLLHVHLEPGHFSPEALGDGFDGSEYSTMRFERGFEDDLIASIGHAILLELQNSTPSGKLLVESLACSVAARLIQRFTSAAPARLLSLEQVPNPGIKRLRQVMDYIEDNIESTISLNDLAAVACLSRFHFARSFKSATGKTPQRYVNERRMERARYLLRHSTYSVAEVAMILSFSSQATFSRAFRQHTEQTPNEFARQSRSRRHNIP